MLHARDIMTAEPVSVTPETKVTEAIRLMLEKHFNGLPVVDGQGHLLGVVTQSDLVYKEKKMKLPSFFVLLDGFIPLSSPKKFEDEVRQITAVTVGDAMTTEVKTVTPDTPLEEIASLMVDEKYYTLPVVEGAKLVGIVGKEDVLRTMVRS